MTSGSVSDAAVCFGPEAFVYTAAWQHAWVQTVSSGRPPDTRSLLDLRASLLACARHVV